MPEIDPHSPVEASQHIDKKVGQHGRGRTTVAYAATMTPDQTSFDQFTITPSDGSAFTIAAPIGAPQDGRRISIRIRNTFGVLGAVTWNAVFKLAAWTNPANGFSRAIEFAFDGTNWVEINRNTADVAN